MDPDTLFTVSVVSCDLAKNDTYAKNVECQATQQTEQQPFQFIALFQQVSTNFDPDIYSSEQKLQLSSQYYIAGTTENSKTTAFVTGVENSVNTFKNDFFFSSYEETIKTAEWQVWQ